ncbi:MAG: hypothetical protein IKM13_08170 [Clostridia bacterium]|nr:hypothetical protein [Clostridia bacterium]
MKKLICLLLIVTLPFCLSSCILAEVAELLRDAFTEEETEETTYAPEDSMLYPSGAYTTVFPFDGEVVYSDEWKEYYEGLEEIPSLVITPEEVPDVEYVPLPEEEPKEEEPKEEKPQKENNSTSLSGYWASVSRSGDLLIAYYYWFSSDGTASSNSVEYEYQTTPPEYMADSGPGWYAAPMGYPLSIGTYEIKGDTLTITFTEEDIGITYDPPVVENHKFSLSGDTLTLSGNKYLKGFRGSVEELAEALGVDTSIN